jgi:hypothetical protein
MDAQTSYILSFSIEAYQDKNTEHSLQTAFFSIYSYIHFDTNLMYTNTTLNGQLLQTASN